MFSQEQISQVIDAKKKTFLNNEKIVQVVQVCYELLPENREREIRGLVEAMDFFKTDNGLIVSSNQHDTFVHNGKQVHVLPAYEFLTQD